MITHDHDTDENPSSKSEISFKVDTTESVGELVFPEQNEESSPVEPKDEGHDASIKASVEDSIEESIEDSRAKSADSIVAEESSEESLAFNDGEEVDLGLEMASEDEALGQDESNLAGDVVNKTSEEESDDDSSDALGLKEDLTLSGKIESIIFASPKPMRAVEVHELLLDQGYTLKEVQDACDELIEFYRDRAGGFHLKYIKRMGYQFQTTPAAKPLMERQFSSRPRPLSRAALETLAVIAYRQKQSKGVTRAEVEFIRGVDAGSIFKTLVERNLLTCVGRKEIPGRPMMFGVTDEFLKVFQLGSINDLPPLESFQTPQDVLDAANQKIADFEAEQAGVDTEEFIGDEDYTAEVHAPEPADPLATDAPVYAPTLERLSEVREGVAAAENETPLEISSEPEAESAADLIDVLGEGQVAWADLDGHTEERSIQGATAGGMIPPPASMDEDMGEEMLGHQVIDQQEIGHQVIEHQVIDRQEIDYQEIDEEEWDENVQVETTSTNDLLMPAASSSEAQTDERDETSEVAVPIGDSEPPRGGEVDQ